MGHPYWSLSKPLPNIIRIFQTIKKIQSAQEFHKNLFGWGVGVGGGGGEGKSSCI